MHEGEEAFQREHVDCVQGATDWKGILIMRRLEVGINMQGASTGEKERVGGGVGRGGDAYFVEEFAQLFE
jgi:hypothetical protein